MKKEEVMLMLIPPKIAPIPIDEDGALIDIRAIAQQTVLDVADSTNATGYRALKQTTHARLGLGRVGTRYTTRSVLRLRADHAAAKDAVWSDVAPAFIDKMGFISIQSTCQTETEYLKRPDHGRTITAPMLDKVRHAYPKPPRVLIAVGDGLSSAAIEANVHETIPAIKRELAHHHIKVGPIPFIRYARVATEDYLGEALKADVVCLLIGERPGLVTAKSMSAYMAYRPTVGMPESRRTVISNIHPDGIPATEAGTAMAAVIVQMLTEKTSGLALGRQQLKLNTPA